MSPARKYTFATAFFYVVALPLIPIFNKFSPTGPCNFGFGLLFLCFVLLASIGAFVVSVAGSIRGKRAFKGPAMINGSVLLLLAILIYFNWI